MNDTCAALETPRIAVPAIMEPIENALEQIALPTAARIAPPKKNHLLPKMSLSRPTSGRATVRPSVKTTGT